MTDPKKKVSSFHILTDDIIQLEWENEDAFLPEDLKTNVFLAEFTTAWARLKLYDVLDRLNRRVLYFDTDSIVYLSRPGEDEPPLGDFLGELTDELDGDHIVHFVSGGPKNYGYKTYRGKEVVKVRGFTLHHTNRQLIHFDSIRELVTGPPQTITVTNPRKITREKRKRTLYNREEKKDYRMVYDKRVILDNLDTLPYGY